MEKISRRKFIADVSTGLASGALLPVTEFFSGIEDKEKEAFIKKNIEEIKSIIHNNNCEGVLANPYLVSILYYSNDFLNETTPQQKTKSVYLRIINEVLPLITVEFKSLYINYLSSLEEVTKEDESFPLENLRINYGKNNHLDAIDLFIEEGSPIHAFAGGVVVLAENTWKKDNEMSTSSVRGGNTVIVFNSTKKEFYRYAHMENTTEDAKPGQSIKSGAKLGTVGHTGLNATKAGHGGHLHFEIHKLNMNTIGNDNIMLEEIQNRLERVLINSKN